MATQTLDIIYVNIWNILLSLINLLLIFLILKKLLYKPVKKILSERKAAVDSIYDEAYKEKNQAEESKLYYEGKLSDLNAEADKIISDATKRANEKSSEIINDANEKAAASVRRANENIEIEKRRAMNEMKNEITDISVRIAEKLIHRELTDKDNQKLVDDFIDNISNGED